MKKSRLMQKLESSQSFRTMQQLEFLQSFPKVLSSGKLNVEVEVFKANTYELPESFESLLQVLQSKMAEIPKEHQSKARIMFECWEESEDYCINQVSIWYKRLETDEEHQARNILESEKLEEGRLEKERLELEQLEYLQRKYPKCAGGW